ncbi:MAG: hypothetical protein Q7S87_01145 [Agitococcus sp.]|nr:hypothetical protein [Agitococcus sp.]MDO9179133.1 hypothetical protein [Agitococcus sp.]
MPNLSESYTLSLAQQCLATRSADYFLLRESGNIPAMEEALLSVNGALRTLENQPFSEGFRMPRAKLAKDLAMLANWLLTELLPLTAYRDSGAAL